jgi:hypothetical protein
MADAAQAEQEDPTPPGHSLIFISIFFCFFFPKKSTDARTGGGHLYRFLGGMPDILCWLYSKLYLGRFQTDGLKNRTLIEKVFVGETPFFGTFCSTLLQIFLNLCPIRPTPIAL